MRDFKTKAFADYDMPRRSKFLVHCFFYHSGCTLKQILNLTFISQINYNLIRQGAVAINYNITVSQIAYWSQFTHLGQLNYFCLLKIRKKCTYFYHKVLLNFCVKYFTIYLTQTKNVRLINYLIVR